jgi:hypothetical protein
MQEDLQKLIEGLSDVERGRRAGQYWGHGAQARRQARRLSHPWAGVELGVRDSETQARIMAEGWLNAGPSATLPRLRPQDGSWAALCYSYPDRANGAMTWLSNYLTLGSLIQPEEWRRAAVLLEWQAFAGLQVAIFVPGPNGSVIKEAKRGAGRRTVIGNDFRGIYLDQPFNAPAGVFELGISFS